MPKQRTTEDVYYRLIHDGDRFETENVLIGYMDRIRGSMEMKFASFLPIRDGGEIPFHRLRYFRGPRGLLYDRTSGVDCVFESNREGVESGYGVPPSETIEKAIEEATWNREIVEYNALQRQKRKKQRWQSSKGKGTRNNGAISQTNGDNQQEGLSIPMFAFQGNQWVLANTNSKVNEDASMMVSFDGILKVISFNVLFDRFDESAKANEMVTTARWLCLLNHVRGLNAHIICFQECTPRFVQLALEQDWIQSLYFSTASLQDFSTITPDGQLTLSRFPVTKATKYGFSQSKSVILSELNVFGRRLIVPCVHLTSDYRGAKSTLRNQQLETIINICRTWDDNEEECDVLLVGDFNCAHEREDLESLTCLADFIDVWRHIWPEDPGYTFDPTSNRLAAVEVSDVTHVKTSKRCDRMFLSSCRNWAPFAASLIDVSVNQNQAVELEVAEEALVYEGPLSDHNGLVFEFCATSSPPSLPSSSSSLSSSSAQAIENIKWQRHATASTFYEDGGECAYQGWRIVADRSLEVLRLAADVCGCVVMVEVGAGSASVALPFSDVDVVIFGIRPSLEFLPLLSESLANSKEYSNGSIRIVDASVMPCLRVDETDVPALDVQYVCAPELLRCFLESLPSSSSIILPRKTASDVIRRYQTDLSQPNTTSLSPSMSEHDSKSIEAILDCDLMLKSAITSNSKLPKNFLLNLFRKTTRCIKLWAKRQGIYGTAFGYPGGFAISVLVSSFISEEAPQWDHSHVNKKNFHLEFIQMFFDHYSHFPWDQYSVSVLGNVLRHLENTSSTTSSVSSVPMSVLTPDQHQNSCRSSNPVCFQIFQEELSNAAISLNSSAHTSTSSLSTATSVLSHSFLLPKVKDFLSSSNYFLCLEVRVDIEKELKMGLGFLESRVLSILLNVRKIQGVEDMRPWSSSFDLKSWHSPFDVSLQAEMLDEDKNTEPGHGGGFVLIALAMPTSSTTSSRHSAFHLEELNKVLETTLHDPFNEGGFTGMNCRSGLVEKHAIVKQVSK